MCFTNTILTDAHRGCHWFLVFQGEIYRPLHFSDIVEVLRLYYLKYWPLIHCREEGCIGKYAPRGSRDLPKQGFCTPRPEGLPEGNLEGRGVQNPCWGKSRGPRKAYFPIHPNSRQCIDILFYRKIHALGSVLENTRPRECIGNYTQIAG